jgi:osmotically-inducible protein OsmY
MNANHIFRRGGAVVRRTAPAAKRLGRRVAGDAVDAAQRLRHPQRASKAGIDDVTLAGTVELEIFRGTRSPKATVNVSVVEAVVWLRGEVKRPQQIRDLERKARAVPGVRDVENLLHLPATPHRT